MTKKEIAIKAENEFLAWNGRKETDPFVLPMLLEYWQKGAGWKWVTKENIKEVASKYAWSAAFVAYIMRLEYSYFPLASTHAKYTVDARERRENGEKKFIAYEINEYKPEVGDIVVKKRGYKGNLKNLISTDTTHGDIVTKVNNGNIEVIGGNVSNTIKKTVIPTINGFITDSNFIAVIKM